MFTLAIFCHRRHAAEHLLVLNVRVWLSVEAEILLSLWIFFMSFPHFFEQ